LLSLSFSGAGLEAYRIRHTAYGIRHTAYGIRHTLVPANRGAIISACDICRGNARTSAAIKT